MSSSSDKKGGLGFAGRMLLFWLPLLALLALVLWVLHRSQVESITAIAKSGGRQSIQLAERTIRSELGLLQGDALFLAEHAALQQWLDQATHESEARLTQGLLAFARHRNLYDQVRFIGPNGRELIRINRQDGGFRAVPKDELQDKAGRYYVRETFALGRNELYISPFDLNIEHGKIEQPPKPMIRLGAAVFDAQGRKRGIIVLNYLGQRLLGQLRGLSSAEDGQLWLLNAEGYWLLGPNPGAEWGFMYPERAQMRFEQYFPDAWAALREAPQSGQFISAQGLFTHARVMPQAGDRHWTIISHQPAALLADRVGGHARNLIITFLVLAILLAMLSAALAHYSERRRQEAARTRASEARFRGLLDSAPDPIVIVDQTGCIALTNAQVEKRFGYGRTELIGQPIEVLIPERLRKAHVADRDRYLARPVTRPMGERAELHGLRKDGSEFPVEISLSPLETDQGVLVTSIIRDITERKRAETMRLQAQKRYQELIANLPVGVYRYTPAGEGRFLEVNPAMVSMFEADSAEQLFSEPVRELYCNPEDDRMFLAPGPGQDRVDAKEIRLKTLKGREFDAAITAVMKLDENGQVYFDGIVEDIGERKESERRIQQLNVQLQARAIEMESINRELEAFSYSVSHDLRAPLRAMDGFSRALLTEYSEQLDDRGKDRLERIRAAAQRMAALIDDLLKLSRISRTEVHGEPVDLSRIASEIMASLRQQEPARTVAFSVPDELIVHGDARLLRVAMDNLLGNAWKFTSRRADAIIEVGSKTDGDEPVYFVRDNGAGFNMAYADKLFGAFQRLHDTQEFPGTGIGLATVQRVIHKHGGRIWAESEVGKGATFYFTLGRWEGS